MFTTRYLKELFKQGVNISKLLRKELGSLCNDEKIIETTYDVLTGHYIDMMDIPEKAEKRYELCNEISHEITQLGEITSILEPGVGEGTTLTGMLNALGDNMDIYAFDISWSRVAYTRKWMVDHSPTQDVNLFTASMHHIPLPTSSVDVVYTAHAIEPNGGQEEPILKELYRVAKKFLVLVEPAFDLADTKARQRMVEHKYCTNLRETIGLQGYNVLEHRMMESIENPLNPPAITIIEKGSKVDTDLQLVCPQYKTELQKIGGMYYSPEALSVYPIIDNIPCLKPSDAIIASKYAEVVNES
jgi:ubiquinone/menaquinone biosynthesis C-methylase UbiE/uncharacterized protein YbaR (Trm112 family)